MKKLILAALFAVMPLCISAQKDTIPLATDTLQLAKAHITEKSPSERWYKPYVAPAALVSFGLIANATYINKYVQQQAYRYSGGHKLRFDDYIQYAPIAETFLFSNLGVKAKHPLRERLLVSATAYAIMGVLVNATKYSTKVRRPDGSAYNSFPSGHTATAFTGIEILWQEYKDENLWIGISGYAIAATVGIMRLHNNRHWLGDVCVGAGIGILSAKLAYMTLPYTSKWLFGKKTTSDKAAVLYPMISQESRGVGLTLIL